MRALVLWLVAVVVAVIVVACSGKQPCGAANCGTCCDAASDTCVSAVSASACGAAGNTCRACSTGETCSSTGACVRTGSGGGSGTGGSSGTGGGATGTGGGTSGTGGGSSGTGGGSSGTGGGTGGSGGAGGSGGITCPGGALPAMVPIDFPTTCAIPTPCGGNPSGKYDYTAACIGQDEFTSFVGTVEQVCGMGTVQVTGYDGGVQGFAYFQNGQVCRTAQGNVTVYASITGQCVQFCSFVGMGIAQQGYVGSCAVNGTSCDCVATRVINISNMMSPYTTGPTSLTITSTGAHYETCLTGNVLTTRQLDAGTSGAMGRELGTATLTRP